MDAITRRLLPLAVTAALAASAASAAEAAPSDTVALPAALASLTADLRVAMPRGTGSAALEWNGGKAEIKAVGNAFDDISGSALRLTVCRADSVVFDEDIYGDFDPSRAGVTMRLHAGPRGGRLEVGTRRPRKTVELDFPMQGARYMSRTLGPGTNLLRFDVEADSMPVAQFAPFADVQSLLDHLASTADVNETVWTYLDRSNNPLKCVPGGLYTLASIACEGGGYILVYLGGAEANARQWEPLRIKGRLHPTIFPGHFDLEWISADGLRIVYETSATITGGSLMELNFPAWHTSMRFKRQIQGELQK